MPTATASDLVSVSLFESLSEEELAEIAGWFEVKDVSPDVRLVGEGATGYSFFVVVDGQVSVTAQGEEIASLGPGDFFGEMALLGPTRRQATVTTTTPTRVLVLFGNEFRRLEAGHPEIAAKIQAVMDTRLGELR